jgi:hypothetical protein
VDATRRIKATLKGVALPQYRRMDGVGDEAYLDDGGWALFRINSLEIHIIGHKVKAAEIKLFAEQIAVTVRAP